MVPPKAITACPMWTISAARSPMQCTPRSFSESGSKTSLSRPEWAVGCIDELGGDADLIARLAHAALEDGGDVEFFPDGGYVLVLALERERRGARGHVQARYLRQQVQQLLAQPVGEVLLLLVGAEVDQ